MPDALSVVFTIGHSILPLSEFLARLEAHGVKTLVDVRSRPRSTRHPHFSGGPLAAALAERGIHYVHRPDLGGLRAPRPDSRHRALRVDAFRGYADHMETAEFAAGRLAVEALARESPTAVMCAEARPADCHRSMLSDALRVAGVRVEHIVDTGPRVPHQHPRTLRVENGVLVYDAGQRTLLD